MAAERREHRLALEILYAVDIGKTQLNDALRQARENIGVFNRGDEAHAEDRYEPLYPAVNARSDAPRATDWTLVEALVRGTVEHQAELEGDIKPVLQHWTIERLSEIDRLILTLGAWELRYRLEADTLAVINHAVELARRLSTADSAHFVNAILDAFAKTQPAQSEVKSNVTP